MNINNLFNETHSYGTLTDIDGNSYHTLIIGSQTWMVENLQVTRFNDGVPILKTTSAIEWVEAYRNGIPAWCYYNFKDKFKVYGKIYNWHAVMSVNGIAPEGWKIPSDTDWQELVSNFSHIQHPAKVLKSKTGWLTKYQGNNLSGFSAVGGGQLISGGYTRSTNFSGLNSSCFWWTNTESFDFTMFAWYILSSAIDVNSCCLQGTSGFNKARGFYIRLIKEE